MGIHQFLKFEPILKEKIWGGNKLMTILNKKSTQHNIGESWEISDVDNSKSVVAEGSLKGTSLSSLISKYKGDLVGQKVYASYKNTFPLLIKFIDAKEALSIQLHPNDKLAEKRHNSFGKTEMWYVMQADENANLIVGFNKQISKTEYVQHVENKSLIDILNVDKVHAGDVYFIPTGRIHAIGAGVMLAEIQQTSDVTYRVYDWDRPNPDGTFRELHTKEAIDALDYEVNKSYKTTYQKKNNGSAEIISCPYFTTNVLQVTSKQLINHTNKDSFVIYMCVKGNASFEYENQTESLAFGETLLVPACVKQFIISSEGDTELLEVFIQD